MHVYSGGCQAGTAGRTSEAARRAVWLVPALSIGLTICPTLLRSRSAGRRCGSVRLGSTWPGLTRLGLARSNPA